jgi:mRNA-degrading endonuclease toxin of MazEF toxin-antitoxin module
VHPFEAKILMPQGEKKVMLGSIRSIDKLRVQKHICAVTSKEMQEIERALRIAIALP